MRNCRWAGQGSAGSEVCKAGLHAEAAETPHQAILGSGPESFGALGQLIGKGWHRLFHHLEEMETRMRVEMVVRTGSARASIASAEKLGWAVGEAPPAILG